MTPVGQITAAVADIKATARAAALEEAAGWLKRRCSCLFGDTEKCPACQDAAGVLALAAKPDAGGE